jgi:hypothetical protein
MINWFKNNISNLIGYILVILLMVYTVAFYVMPTSKPEVLKDFKDGIQNHLVWSIKGECFFVRPHAETTVYLIRVADCDRK